MQHYSLPRFRTVDELLVLLAHKFQRVKKGGVPDKDKAARAVLQDWNTGKIPFYTLPPKQDRGNTDASVVSQWAAEFDMDAVLAGEKKTVLDELPERVRGGPGLPPHRPVLLTQQPTARPPGWGLLRRDGGGRGGGGSGGHRQRGCCGARPWRGGRADEGRRGRQRG